MSPKGLLSTLVTLHLREIVTWGCLEYRIGNLFPLLFSPPCVKQIRPSVILIEVGRCARGSLGGIDCTPRAQEVSPALSLWHLLIPPNVGGDGFQVYEGKRVCSHWEPFLSCHYLRLLDGSFNCPESVEPCTTSKCGVLRLCPSPSPCSRCGLAEQHCLCLL